jgi:hypothetical protein
MAASKTKASAELHSPAPSLALTPYVPLPASFLQAPSFSQSGLELVRWHPRPTDYGGLKWYRHNTISSMLALSVEQRSPLLIKTGSPPIAKPDCVWTGHGLHPSSLELVWWECAKPPNMAAYRQFLCRAIVTFLGVITFLLLKAQVKYTEPSLLVA